MATGNIESAAAQPASVALFVSDVHLSPDQPLTTETFLGFLENHASKASHLYLLGDLFEYWAGDDDLADPFNQHIAKSIRRLAEKGVRSFWLAGNCDFLVAQEFSMAAGMTALDEPHVVTIHGARVALAHGDAQCTDDEAYMAFRAKVREASWQAGFLALPLAQRKAIIGTMRSGSREAQRAKTMEIMDVNDLAIDSLFRRTGASVIVHGHTHRPAAHVHASGHEMRMRYVLPDWDCEGMVKRGGWIALDATGTWQRYDAHGSPVKWTHP